MLCLRAITFRPGSSPSQMQESARVPADFVDDFDTVPDFLWRAECGSSRRPMYQKRWDNCGGKPSPTIAMPHRHRADLHFTQMKWISVWRRRPRGGSDIPSRPSKGPFVRTNSNGGYACLRWRRPPMLRPRCCGRIFDGTGSLPVQVDRAGMHPRRRPARKQASLQRRIHVWSTPFRDSVGGRR